MQSSHLPKVPPPLNNKAVLPKLCRIVVKNSNFARRSSSGSDDGSSHIQFNCRTTSSMYDEIKVLVPLLLCEYNC